MGLFALLLIVFFMIDPERGLAEGAHLRPSSPMIDLRALAKNKSFVLSTVGFTCVTFTAGSLMWWGPEFAFLGEILASIYDFFFKTVNFLKSFRDRYLLVSYLTKKIMYLSSFITN